MPGAPALKAGDTFEILGFVSAAGAFSALNLPDLGGSLNWNTANLLYSGVIEVISGLPGNFNHDGTVDAADYVVWRKIDGSPEGYNTWRAHFGQPTGSAADSNATVPEPATLVTVLFGALVIFSQCHFMPRKLERSRGTGYSRQDFRHRWSITGSSL